MSDIGLRFDTTKLTEGLARLAGQLDSINRRACTRTGTTVKAFMARAVAADIGSAVGAVKDQIDVKASTESVQVSTRGGRIPLINFKARGPEPSRGKGSGVSYSIGQGGRGRAPHAFIATMPSGHRGVFQRSRFGRGGVRYSKHASIDKKTGRPRTSQREVIEELRGPSIPHVFKKYAEEGAAVGRAAMLGNLRHELTRFAQTEDFPLRPVGSDSGPSPEE